MEGNSRDLLWQTHYPAGLGEKKRGGESLMKVGVMVKIRTTYLFLQLETIFSVKQTYNP